MVCRTNLKKKPKKIKEGKLFLHCFTGMAWPDHLKLWLQVEGCSFQGHLVLGSPTGKALIVVAIVMWISVRTARLSIIWSPLFCCLNLPQ